MGHILMDQQVAGVLALICVVPGDSLSTDVLAAEAGIPSADFGQVWREQFGEPLALTMHRLQGRCAALASTTIQSLHDSIGPNWGVVSPRAFVDALRHLCCFMPCDFHRSARLGESLGRGLSIAYSGWGVEIVSLAPFALIVKRDFETGDPGLLAAAMDKFWGWAEVRGLLPGLQGVYVIPGNKLQSKSFIALRYDAGIDFGNEESLSSAPTGQQIINVSGGNWARVRFREPFLGVEAACLHLYGAWVWASRRGLVSAPLFTHYLGDPERNSRPVWQTDVYLPLKPL